MKKVFLLLVFVLMGLTVSAGTPAEYKEGDIVFIISKSEQSPLIQYATRSLWSHCGIVVYKNKGTICS